MGVSSSSWGKPQKGMVISWNIPSFDSWMMTGGRPILIERDESARSDFAADESDAKKTHGF